jgi:choline dehydrogenase-like flavoprotein
VCDEDHEVHGVPDLYVMDGSCFPTASGVNPMLTIESLAHRAASRLGARLS